MRFALCLGAILTVVCLASCGAAAGGRPGEHLTLREADKGRTVDVHPGAGVVVVLDSTYWRVAPSSDPAVLREDGQPVYAAHPSGCVPGEGCGTVTATFHAVSAGRATISASRTSCGEAMGCTASAGSYQVTVVVGT